MDSSVDGGVVVPSGVGEGEGGGVVVVVEGASVVSSAWVGGDVVDVLCCDSTVGASPRIATISALKASSRPVTSVSE